MTSTGLHHVTAISGPAQRNLDFYTRVLGLRLVEKTVNFDDPGFAYDEPAASLGQALKLPSFLECSRTQIEAVLPQLA